MIGDECTQARDMLETSYPITNGIVTNWEDMTHLCAAVPVKCRTLGLGLGLAAGTSAHFRRSGRGARATADAAAPSATLATVQPRSVCMCSACAAWANGTAPGARAGRGRSGALWQGGFGALPPLERAQPKTAAASTAYGCSLG